MSVYVHWHCIARQCLSQYRNGGHIFGNLCCQSKKHSILLMFRAAFPVCGVILKAQAFNTAKALMKCKHLLLFFWMSHIIEDLKTQKQMKREKRFSHKVEAKWLACSPYTAAQAASFMYMYESPYTCESHLYLRSKCHVQKPNSKFPIFNLVLIRCNLHVLNSNKQNPPTALNQSASTEHLNTFYMKRYKSLIVFAEHVTVV